jgi:hypothetical protein
MTGWAVYFNGLATTNLKGLKQSDPKCSVVHVINFAIMDEF